MINQDIWDKLNNNAEHPNLNTDEAGFWSKHVSGFSGAEILYSLDRFQRTCGVIIREEGVDIRKIPQVSSTKGFIVIPIPESPEQKYSELRITISDPHYNGIFKTFASDLLKILKAKPESSGFIEETLHHLRKWINCMTKVSPRELSNQEIQGLFGELHFIRYNLVPSIGIKNAVKAWFGPDSNRQDFLFMNNLAVEIKTTASKSPARMHISNEDQLDTRGLDALYLHHLTLFKSVKEEDSIVELVDDLNILCEEFPDVYDDFKLKLLQIGYCDDDRDKYLTFGYSVLEEKTFHVSDDFPRLTSENIMPGVCDVKYSIAVDFLENYSVSQDEFMAKLKRGYDL